MIGGKVMKRTIVEFLTAGALMGAFLFCSYGAAVVQAAPIAGASQTLSDALLRSESYIGIKYSVGNVNVRTEPNTDSEVVCTLIEYEPIRVWETHTDWYETKSGYYIRKDLLTDEVPSYQVYSLYSTFKSFTDWQLVTASDTPQYKLLRSESYSGDYGIRMVDGRYCVALASSFNCRIGQKFDIILENDEIIPCIMCDQKDDLDTDGMYTLDNGCATEFYVDTNILYHPAKHAGDLSEIPGWNSSVVKIKVYEED